MSRASATLCPELRAARGRAGLSQRALPTAGTTQSVVVRIERGATSPVGYAHRPLRAAGFDLEAEIVPRPTARSHMMGDVARILSCRPRIACARWRAVSRFLAGTRRA